MMHDIGIKNHQQETLENLLSRKASYEIPYFQREFSWRKDECSDFWDDALKSKDKKKGHFFGFMTFRKEGDVRIFIIEGQQRLTAVTLLIALVRDMLYDLDDDSWRDIEREYIKSKHPLFPDNPPMPKMTLSEMNRDFFKKFIQDADKPRTKIERMKKQKRINSSNLLLVGCYQYFYQQLKDMIAGFYAKEKIDYLLEVIRVVLGNFVVLTSEVTNPNAAYNIFQTLNDRGLDLTLSDLLKIYLLEKAEPAWSQARDKWNEIRETLSVINTNTFLRHYWVSREGVVKEKELLGEIEKKIKKKSQVFKFLEDLKDEAENYEALLNPTTDYWGDKRTRKLLRELQYLSTQQVLPLLMAACTLPVKELNKIITACINFIFRYLTIAERENKVLERLFSDIAVGIRRGVIKNSSHVIAKLRKEYVDDEMFEKLFSNKEIKTVKVARYILEKIEDSFGEKEKFSEKITLEHVLPRNPDDEWMEYLNKKKIDKDQWVYRIGNLTLLLGKVNKKARNRFFTKKRDEIYKRMTKLKINEDLQNINDWTGKEIQTRQNWMAKRAKKIWILETK